VIAVSSLAFQLPGNDGNVGLIDWSDIFFSGWELIVAIACLLALLAAVATVAHETYQLVGYSQIKARVRANRPSIVAKVRSLTTISTKKAKDAFGRAAPPKPNTAEPLSGEMGPSRPIPKRPKLRSCGLNEEELLTNEQLGILKLFSVSTLRQVMSKKKRHFLSDIVALMSKVKATILPCSSFGRSEI
jgi:hypothetical protein